MRKIRSHKRLLVYQNAFEAAMLILELSKTFPISERFELTNQIRRSSRSVCANLAEAWRKRRYKAAFIAKLSDCESEACETQVHLEFSVRCGYLNEDTSVELNKQYDHIIAQLITMIRSSDKWVTG
ncbi:MAG: four helix bundle protein [Calditrichia bacterium]